ncbi:MAG: hypothetical protein WC091_20040 [Sulfuricellaceae bacterium]
MKYDFPFIVSKVLPSFFRDLSLIQSSEANFASLLYHHLVNAGVLPTQLCTEMYTANIVKEGIRPDLVIFDEEISGRFNYYKDCDKHQDNTALKLQHIRCVLEIKGGAQQHESGLGKYFESDLLCDQLRSDPEKRRKTQNCALVVDIEKLGMWASQFGTQGRDYVFLTIDLKNPRGFWPDNVRNTYGEYCAKNGVHMIYFAQGSSTFWHYPCQGEPIQICVA